MALQLRAELRRAMAAGEKDAGAVVALQSLLGTLRRDHAVVSVELLRDTVRDSNFLHTNRESSMLAKPRRRWRRQGIGRTLTQLGRHGAPAVAAAARATQERWKHAVALGKLAQSTDAGTASHGP